MIISLFLDILVAVLLVVTISYAVVLNRRLTGLRRDKAELEKLTASFEKATRRAVESTMTLKGTAHVLQDRVDTAASLREDLQFLIERGTATADRLEAGVRASRAGGAAGSQLATATAPAPNSRGEGAAKGVKVTSEADRQLLKALQSAR